MNKTCIYAIKFMAVYVWRSVIKKNNNKSAVKKIYSFPVFNCVRQELRKFTEFSGKTGQGRKIFKEVLSREFLGS